MITSDIGSNIQHISIAFYKGIWKKDKISDVKYALTANLPAGIAAIVVVEMDSTWVVERAPISDVVSPPVNDRK